MTSFVIGPLLGAVEYIPFKDYRQAAETANANSLQDETGYGIWTKEDELVAISFDGELFVKKGLDQ